VLLLLVIFLVVVTIVRNVAVAGNMLLVERVSQRTGMEIRQQCFRNTLRMETSVHDHKHSGELIGLFTNHMQIVVDGVRSVLGTGIREPLKMAACLVGAALVSWQLLLLSLLADSRGGGGRRGLAEERQTCESTHDADDRPHVQAAGGGRSRLLPLVKAFTLEHAEQERFQAAVGRLYKNSMRISPTTRCRAPGPKFSASVSSVWRVLMGGYLVLNQGNADLRDRGVATPAERRFTDALLRVSDRRSRAIAEAERPVHDGARRQPGGRSHLRDDRSPAHDYFAAQSCPRAQANRAN